MPVHVLPVRDYAMIDRFIDNDVCNILQLNMLQN